MEGQEPVVEYEGTDDVDVLGVAATETTQKTLEELNILPLEQGVIKELQDYYWVKAGEGGSI